MKSHNKNILIILAFLCVMIFSFILGVRYDQQMVGGNLMDFDFGKNNKVNRVLNLIRKNYVDSVNVDSLENLAIGEILDHLDPHSIYLPPTQAKKQSESLEGNFEGIGIEYYLLSDTIFITSVRPSGPSEKAGLLKGDKIIAVNGEALTGKGLLAYNLVNKLKGKRGSAVEVSVLRYGSNTPRSFSIVRDQITVSSIDIAYMINPETAFVKISKFDVRTEEDFANELSKLEKKGMKNLILDLRGNGGGYLSAATGMADQFLRDNELIVYTKGLHEPRTDYRATNYGIFENGKLAILIDEHTASASEIVAGAVQDLDRGHIIGRRSYGKGLVQEQFAFEDGSAMNLTVARYFTPSGRSIQKSYDRGSAEYKQDLLNRFNKGEFSIEDTLKQDSDHKAFKTSKGREVFSGCGITPDYFIPIDTSYLTEFYRKVNENNLLLEFTYRFLINNKQPVKYRSSDDFQKYFNVSNDVIGKFVSFAKEKGIDYSPGDITRSTPKLRKEIKALMARYYFKEEGFHKVLNSSDRMVGKALELFTAAQ